MYATQIQIHEDKLYLYEKFKFNLKLRYYFSIKVTVYKLYLFKVKRTIANFITGKNKNLIRRSMIYGK